MKRIFFFVVILISVCVCSSPHKDFLTSDVVSLKTKTVEVTNINNFITNEEIHAFADKFCSERNNVQSITPFFKDGTLVFYIINFSEGWMILSADRRGPIVIAHSDVGRFFMDQVCEEEKIWFENTANQIIFRINHPGEYYSVVSKDALKREKSCVSFWNVVNADTTFFSTSLLGNRQGVLTNSYLKTIIYESVNHLIPVFWHQGHPFNLYCPLKAQGDTARCPAGCAAVAVGQTLYYLHDTINCPQYSPSIGFCIGWAGNCSQSFPAFSDNTWDYMSDSTDTNGYAALLLGYLGKNMQMHYGPNASGTTLKKMYSVFGSCFGIHCDTLSYQLDVAYQSLRSRMPVICIGNKVTTSDTTAHAFIIDGYESCIIETHYEYTLPSGEINDIVAYSDTLPTHFRINWGQGSFGRNSLYSASGSWMDYDFNRKVICHFMTENK